MNLLKRFEIKICMFCKADWTGPAEDLQPSQLCVHDECSLLWQAVILHVPSCGIWLFLHHPIKHSTALNERHLHFPLCWNQVQIGRNGMTEYLCPTCSNAAHKMYIGKDTQPDDRRQPIFGRDSKKTKIRLKASSDSASGRPWQTSGKILPGDLSSVEGWEDLSGWLTTSALLMSAAHVPTESAHHCLESKAARQRHCGVVFILYSLYFGTGLRSYVHIISTHSIYINTYIPIDTHTYLHTYIHTYVLYMYMYCAPCKPS